MSYSAFVNCNCYTDGKTAAPPYKEFISFDDEGVYLEITSEMWKKNEELCYKMDKEFDEWKRTACEHKDMNAAYEYLSNMSGMAAFKHIVHKLGGKDKFPILTEYLPTVNGGTLPAGFANKLLQELEDLGNETTPEEFVSLQEKSTGDLKASVKSDSREIFVYTANNKINYGIDKDGFFILQNKKKYNGVVPKIVFRSINFLQQTISKSVYRFIDIPTTKSFECSVKLHPDEENVAIEFEFIVIKKKNAIANEYQYILEPLRKLAIASLLTGNPIIWT
ncbi:hypothetical protein Q4E93_23755 [Flavitalea sp. BT771]|uniref:hypothetical protein n=1 Tax=Flavitalea sp. BT771 TaxID=3063329 RepID=UPI0026E297D9|nr:hypothetical protein [Flavitalea sp. BT771]MDO6433647.1 hypothetical protein [Flavitalea sp. BT771]MDV6222448.1 hypothetical protein [Flavitalea sp. BT771]